MKAALPFGTFLAVGAAGGGRGRRPDLHLVRLVLPMTRATASSRSGFIGGDRGRRDDADLRRAAPVVGGQGRAPPAARERLGNGAPVGGAAGRGVEAQGAGAGDERPRRRVRAAERPDRREPHRRPAGRGPRRPRRDPEPGRPAHARRARRRRSAATIASSSRRARTAGAHRATASRPRAPVARRTHCRSIAAA